MFKSEEAPSALNLANWSSMRLIKGTLALFAILHVPPEKRCVTYASFLTEYTAHDARSLLTRGTRRCWLKNNGTGWMSSCGGDPFRVGLISCIIHWIKIEALHGNWSCVHGIIYTLIRERWKMLFWMTAHFIDHRQWCLLNVNVLQPTVF